jgi:hypothetical protein
VAKENKRPPPDEEPIGSDGQGGLYIYDNIDDVPNEITVLVVRGEDDPPSEDFPNDKWTTASSQPGSRKPSACPTPNSAKPD